VAIREQTMAADHPALAQNLNNLGEDYRHLGEPERALELHTRALAIWETKLGPEHPDVALSHTAIGDDLLALGRLDEALPHLERALVIRAGESIDPVERAHTQWAMARALWGASVAAGRDRARAPELARAALETFAADEEPELEGEVRAWLASIGASDLVGPS
jgi:eukaryotic-like serine/threonine-protein kinase